MLSTQNADRHAKLDRFGQLTVLATPRPPHYGGALKVAHIDSSCKSLSRMGRQAARPPISAHRLEEASRAKERKKSGNAFSHGRRAADPPSPTMANVRAPRRRPALERPLPDPARRPSPLSGQEVDKRSGQWLCVQRRQVPQTLRACVGASPNQRRHEDHADKMPPENKPCIGVPKIVASTPFRVLRGGKACKRLG